MSADVAQQEAEKAHQGRELPDPEEKVPFREIEPEIGELLNHFDPEFGNLVIQAVGETLLSLSHRAIGALGRDPVGVSEHCHKTIRRGIAQSFTDGCRHSQSIHYGLHFYAPDLDDDAIVDLGSQMGCGTN